MRSSKNVIKIIHFNKKLTGSSSWTKYDIIKNCNKKISISIEILQDLLHEQNMISLKIAIKKYLFQ
jgi:hypothetical protein